VSLGDRNDQQLLLNAQLLSDLSDAVLDQLTQDAFVHGLPKGTVLFDQGGSAKFLHLILSGRVAITAQIGPDETILLIRESGEAILDPATLLGVPYSVGARLVEGGRIMMIPVSKFRELVFTNLTTGSATLRAVVNTNLALMNHIRDLKLLTTVERLARYLLSLTAAPSGSVTLALRDDRLVLAALLGMTPESLSRAFGQLRALGIRADKKGAIAIDNIRKLRAYCQSKAGRGDEGR
jgi:CRP/FNR family transcriptional activator FtrB